MRHDLVTFTAKTKKGRPEATLPDFVAFEEVSAHQRARTFD
jgi:hypothetical protein